MQNEVSRLCMQVCIIASIDYVCACYAIACSNRFRVYNYACARTHVCLCIDACVCIYACARACVRMCISLQYCVCASFCVHSHIVCEHGHQRTCKKRHVNVRAVNIVIHNVFSVSTCNRLYSNFLRSLSVPLTGLC